VGSFSRGAVHPGIAPSVALPHAFGTGAHPQNTKKRPASFTLIRTPAVLPCVHARRGGFSAEALTSVVEAGRLPCQARKRSVTAIFRWAMRCFWKPEASQQRRCI